MVDFKYAFSIRNFERVFRFTAPSNHSEVVPMTFEQRFRPVLRSDWCDADAEDAEQNGRDNPHDETHFCEIKAGS